MIILKTITQNTTNSLAVLTKHHIFMTNKNSKNKNMKKQINEFKRMQLIAGLITESEYRESQMNESQYKFNIGDKLKTYGGEEAVTVVDVKPHLDAALKDIKNPKSVDNLKQAIRDGFVEDEQKHNPWYLVKFEDGTPTRYWAEDELLKEPKQGIGYRKSQMNESEKPLPKVGDTITDEGKEFKVLSVDKNFIDVKSLEDNKTYHFSSKSWITNYPPVSAHIAEDSPKARILTNVYYIGDNAEGDLAGLAGSAVPAYDLPGYSLRQIEDEGDGMLYMKKGEIGWYDGRIFESELENSTTAVDKKYIELLPMKSSKNSLKENESSAYITIDPEYPTEVELYADSGDYAGDIEKNGKVTFTLTFDEGDSEGTYMNSKDIFDDHAPAVFKKIVKAGGDFDAGDDYVEVTTTLDKLKKLFPMKESSKNSLKENDLANDDLIYDRMLNMDQEQLISKILNYAEKNPTSTLVDYLNSEFGYGEEDY